MTTYEKPMIKINEELAEGVYAAGSGSSGSNNTVSVVFESSYMENGQLVSIYRVHATNNSGAALDSQNITITFDQTVTSRESESVTRVDSGNSVSMEYNRHINDGATNNMGIIKIVTDGTTAPTVSGATME